MSGARISKIDEVVRRKAFLKSSTSSKVEENPEAWNRLENFSWSKLFQDLFMTTEENLEKGWESDKLKEIIDQ